MFKAAPSQRETVRIVAYGGNDLNPMLVWLTGDY